MTTLKIHDEPQPAQAPAAAAPADPGARPATITDSRGRVLKIRELNIVEEQDIIELVGDTRATNRLWMTRTLAICSVAAIDGVEYLVPKGLYELRAATERVGREGLAAIFGAEQEKADAADEEKATAKNSASTPA
ncbi:MAG: hypothetical protein ACHQF3_00095 [Alphaproteobacteria bacterium]